jgi:hypothetical protein
MVALATQLIAITRAISVPAVAADAQHTLIEALVSPYGSQFLARAFAQ